MEGGCFQFFTKNRPQKHQKRAILHTSQANGGARGGPPAPPPPLATLLLPKHEKTTIAINISLQSAQQRQYVF